MVQSENMVLGNLSLCAFNSFVSKFISRILYNIQVMLLYDDLKLTHEYCCGTLNPCGFFFEKIGIGCMVVQCCLVVHSVL